MTLAWIAKTKAQERLAVAITPAKGVFSDKKYEAELKPNTSNRETKENQGRLNAMSSLFVSAISNGLAKQKPKYNAKKDRNLLIILIAFNRLMLCWLGSLKILG